MADAPLGRCLNFPTSVICRNNLICWGVPFDNFLIGRHIRRFIFCRASAMLSKPAFQSAQTPTRLCVWKVAVRDLNSISSSQLFSAPWTSVPRKFLSQPSLPEHMSQKVCQDKMWEFLSHDSCHVKLHACENTHESMIRVCHMNFQNIQTRCQKNIRISIRIHLLLGHHFSCLP